MRTLILPIMKVCTLILALSNVSEPLLFLFIFPTFFNWLFMDTFLNSFCWRIHSHGQKKQLKAKSVRMHKHFQALMCIFVNISTFFKLLSIDAIFEKFLLENSFPWSKIQLIAKSARMHNHFQAFICILFIFHAFFNSIGCLWIPFLSSFCCRIHFHGQKYN